MFFTKASSQCTEELKDDAQRISNIATGLVAKKELPHGFEESVSFSGAAFYFFYHYGVAAYLQETYDLTKVCFLGASSGAFPALFLASDISIKEIMETWTPEAHSILDKKLTGVYFNYAEVVGKVCLKHMHPDAYKKVSGRATISLTNMESWVPCNERISEFASNKNLLDVAFASCHIPYYIKCQYLANLNGKKYIDGALSDYQPVLNDNTIKVSPYMWSFLWNKLPLGLYGSTSDKRNFQLYKDGYDDAKKNPNHWKRLERFRKVLKAKL